MTEEVTLMGEEGQREVCAIQRDQGNCGSLGRGVGQQTGAINSRETLPGDLD